MQPAARMIQRPARIAFLLTAGFAAACHQSSGSGTGGSGTDSTRDGGGPGPAAGCAGLSPGKWVATSAAGAPTPGYQRFTIWTGRELLLFTPTEGAAFEPCANRWRRLSIDGMPPQLPEAQSTGYTPVILAGERVIVLYPPQPANPSAFMPVTAVIYDIASDRWSSLPLGGAAPAPRTGAVTIWTGRELIVWGGAILDEGSMPPAPRLADDGARLDPATGKWTPMAKAGAPSARVDGRAVWTGSRLLVYGCVASPYYCYLTPRPCPAATGGSMYDPATDTWTPISSEGAPAPPADMPYTRLLWTGKRMIAWGGAAAGQQGVFDPAANRWESMGDLAGVPPGDALRMGAAWVEGDRFVMVSQAWTAAAVFDLERRRWTPVSGTPPQLSGYGGTIAGDDGRMLAILARQTSAGLSMPQNLRGGFIARVDPLAARWELAELPEMGSPYSIVTQTVAWTGTRLIFWGGSSEEFDPMGDSGCSGMRPPNLGCDPHIPTKTVFSAEGGMLTPAFARTN